MKNNVVITVSVFVICFLLQSTVFAQAQKIRKKVQRVKQGAITIKQNGGDPSEILELMQKVPPLMKRGRVQEANDTLDKALFLIGEGASQEKVDYTDDYTNEFNAPESITIRGFHDHIMEPFISRDGQYLFWNNLNHPSVNTNLHYATRINAKTYKYRGEVYKANTRKLEGVPTMDEEGNFYFNRGGDLKRMSLIKTGKFLDGQFSDEQPVRVDGLAPGRLAMGAEISPDGNLMFLVMTKFQNKRPVAMDLAIARRINNAHFKILSNSEELTALLNTDELEYAPAMSADGLEIYFNRAPRMIGGVGSKGVAIYIAKRNSLEDSFSAPKRISTIKGFVEGATVLNKDTVYFHKKDSKFRLYQVQR